MRPVITRHRFSQVIPALLALAAVTPLHAASPREAALADSPLGYYELGGVSPATDSVINTITGAAVGTHTGVNHGVANTVIYPTDTATNYNGTTSISTVPYTAALNPSASSSFTVEAWLRPTADGLSNAQVPLYNRATNSPRQGWIFYQRDASTGFNFRMYNGNGTTQSVDLTGGPYTVGQWVHVAVVYDGTAKTATLYVNGTFAQQATNVSYVPNSSEPFCIGGHNGTTSLFSGDIDEVAFYPTALTEAKLFNHSISDGDSYAAMIAADGATYHFRQNEKDPQRVVAVNAGTAGAAANGVHFPGATHQVPGAVLGSTDTAVSYGIIDKTTNDGGYPTVLPYSAALNTENFSAEAWVRPSTTGPSNACAVFRNHNAGAVRSGWVVWQRGTSQGFNFRLYNQNGDATAINITGGTYTVNEWSHLAVTYNASTRTAKLYVNGAEVATQTLASGAADYVPLAISDQVAPSFGGFDNGRENPFGGDMDEVAYYDKVLTPAQVSAHYANARNTSRATPYETLIATDAPVGYYRQNEAAKAQITNLGTLGAAAVGTAVNSPGKVDGPASPSFPGLGSSSTASYFNTLNTNYVELNNPSGMNFTGPISLEAWIKPQGTQPASATIIGHGGELNFASELFLRIESGQYQVGTGAASAKFTIPATDLTGDAWVHLVGTWADGQWMLYRNGELVATQADANGAVLVNAANWAIGSRGRWKAFGYPSKPDGDQRVFNGAIATAGIYNSALNQARVTAHYQAGTTPSTSLSTLTIVQQGANAVLTWTSGTLQQSSDLTNWTDVAGATSPYSTPISDKQFFRLRD